MPRYVFLLVDDPSFEIIDLHGTDTFNSKLKENLEAKSNVVTEPFVVVWRSLPLRDRENRQKPWTTASGPRDSDLPLATKTPRRDILSFLPGLEPMPVFYRVKQRWTICRRRIVSARHIRRGYQRLQMKTTRWRG